MLVKAQSINSVAWLPCIDTATGLLDTCGMCWIGGRGGGEEQEEGREFIDVRARQAVRFMCAYISATVGRRA